MSFFNIENALPVATPATFEFEGREWKLYQVAHPPVAVSLERWVSRFVMRNAEMTRPDADDADPLSWRVYRETLQHARDELLRGFYGALTEGFNQALFNNKAGVGCMLWECVRLKEPDWTQEHVKRLLANEDDYNAMRNHLWEINFPKPPAPSETPPK